MGDRCGARRCRGLGHHPVTSHLSRPGHVRVSVSRRRRRRADAWCPRGELASSAFGLRPSACKMAWRDLAQRHRAAERDASRAQGRRRRAGRACPRRSRCRDRRAWRSVSRTRRPQSVARRCRGCAESRFPPNRPPKSVATASPLVIVPAPIADAFASSTAAASAARLRSFSQISAIVSAVTCAVRPGCTPLISDVNCAGSTHLSEERSTGLLACFAVRITMVSSVSPLASRRRSMRPIASST